MATLKSLVDETTNIKNELKTCHTNLKNNLVEKGVDASSSDKMATLIDKVKDVGLNIPKSVKPKGIWIDCDTHSSYQSEYSDCAVVGNSAYIIGGTGSAKVNEEYNSITNTYTEHSNMNVSKTRISVCSVDNIIYIYGGGNSTVLSYDTVTKTYTTVGTYFSGTLDLDMMTCVVGTDIYLMGGANSSSAKKDNYVYDTITNTYTQKASLLTSRVGKTGYLYNGRIYLIYGGTGNSPTVGCNKNIDCYNISNDTWTTVNTVNDGSRLSSGVVVNDNIYILGGGGSGSQTPFECTRYNITSNTLEVIPSAMNLLEAYATCIINNTIYVFRGNYVTTDVKSDTTHIFIPQ